MTTGQGLMADRRWAAGGMFDAREPAQGFAIISAKPLELFPTEKQPARSPEPSGRKSLAGSHTLQFFQSRNFPSRGADLVFLGRLCSQKVLDEIIPTAPHHVRLVPESMRAVGKENEIEILVRLHQLVDDEKGVVRRNVVVHRAVRE